MCGRLCSTISPELLAAVLGVEPPVPDSGERYNIAPFHPVLAVRTIDGLRRADCLRWGLIPSWNRDPLAQGFINARGETLPDRPSFSESFRKRRCIIPASGFYEWTRNGKVKQPHYVHRKDRRPLLIAGLWDSWIGPQGPVETCVLITVTSNRLLQPLHDRMPAVLETEDVDLWLSPKTHLATLESFLVSPPDEELVLYPVSTVVNSPAHDSPECIRRAPLTDPRDPDLLL